MQKKQQQVVKHLMYFYLGFYMKRILALTLLSISTLISAMDSQDVVRLNAVKAVMANNEVAKVAVIHDEEGFFTVEHNQRLCPVNKHDVDPAIRLASNAKLLNFMKHGYLEAKELSNGEFKLNAHVRGHGGGPVTGKIAGWSVYAVGHIGYGIYCIIHPIGLAEAHAAHEIISVASSMAEAAGFAMPTP